MKHWMFNCKRVSEEISESLDHAVPLHHRMFIRFHLLMCRYCSRFHRQLTLISQAGRDDDCEGKDAPALSQEARERICEKLEMALDLDKGRIDDGDRPD